ncbi:MAG: class I SAM-dependent methyltransferase family protein [Nanoarchaeota archaeon]
MSGILVPFKDAERAKQALKRKGHYDPSFLPKATREGIVLPAHPGALPLLRKEVRSAARWVGSLKAKAKHDIKESLSSAFTKKELSQLKTAHDVIGSIAILEIDRSLRKKKMALAKAIMAQNNAITTVLMKQGGHKGDFRTQKLGFVAGKRTKETEHRENGVRMLLDVEKVYFSPRLANERARIAQQVKPGERILVLFSGCAPYILVIAKHSGAKEIVGVEINPAGHSYALKNVQLNKLGNVKLFCGDARKVAPSLGRFDRVLMPLPKGGEDFLGIALAAAKKGAVVHFYDFLNEKDIPSGAEQKVMAAAKKARRQVKLLQTVRCGQQKAYVFRTCTDFVAQ